MLLTEVLKEREAQLELKKLREQGLIGQDKELWEKHQRELNELKRIEEEEKMKVRLEKLNTAEFQKAQSVTFYSVASWNWFYSPVISDSLLVYMSAVISVS